MTAVLALAVVCAVAWTPRPRAEAPAPLAPRASAPLANAPAPPADGSTADAPATAVRNVFEFVDRTPEAAPAPLPALVVPPPLAPVSALRPASEPIRLVGFVRRGGALRAALSFTGSVSVLAPGEEADGYEVLAVDEDAGVTVRTPDGSELVLPPPDR
jgi:hypothetical protein